MDKKTGRPLQDSEIKEHASIRIQKSFKKMLIRKYQSFQKAIDELIKKEIKKITKEKK
ncbi:hypothetical protein KAR91_40880 [Candidatus Pacearchaeota archaeon]|nr:hypothetical protein [Candidatus Pacearchaeota archaeon]